MNRNRTTWRAVEGALEVTAIAAVECALILGLLAAIGFPHGGL
ncbi:KY49.ctg7180000000025_quiver, whole genome shotgun sequence [Burkholderia multivorans]